MTEEFPLCRQCLKNPVVIKDLVCHECAQAIQAAAETKAIKKDRFEELSKKGRFVRWKPGRLIQWAIFKDGPYSVRIQIFGWNFLVVLCKQPK